MALEPLNNLDGMFNLMQSIKQIYPDEYDNFKKYVNFDFKYDKLEIKFQKGPRKEVGTNGVQFDILLLICQHIIDGLNKNNPCLENVKAIVGLQMSMNALIDRTKNRIKNNIEGTNE